jgi:peptide/nickel transport system permease protein
VRLMRGPWARLESWIPRHSIIGRIAHPLFEERRTLAGRMSWIGLALLIAFLIVALGANVLAPFDPILPVDEIHVPPWTTLDVRRNESFAASTGNWSSAGAARSIDGIGALSSQSGDREQLSSFALEVRRDAIVSVGVLVLILGSGTDPGHYLLLEASRDGGVTWLPGIEVRAADRLERIDLTDVVTWRAADLTRQRFHLRTTHASETGGDGNLTVDFVGATVVWQSHWHLMGTDQIGRDVFSRVLHGTRTSLVIMLIAVSTAFVVGFPLGLYSGYRGGRFDQVLVLIMDSLYAFPGLLFAGLIAVLLGKGVVNIGLAITVIYVPLYFRVTRSQVLSIREELYVEAARALGASRRHIILRYIATNVIIAVPVIFSLSAADAILTAAGLSFLGLGLEGDIPDWGLDLSAGADRIDNGIWWSSFFPGLAIVLLTIGLSFFGEGLNDIINPLLKKERS